MQHFTFHRIQLLTTLCMLPLLHQPSLAQTSGASGMLPSPITQNTLAVPYRISDAGTKLPDITWGLDQAWISEGNMLRGLNFAGQDLIDIVRVSFQPSSSVEGGVLSAAQKKTLDERIRIAKFAKNADIALNSDPQDGKGVDSWYRTSNATTNGQHWAQLIALTKEYVEARGLKVVSVSPFNEPDYSNWNQGSQSDFRATCQHLRTLEEMQGVLLCGGNTLNDDQALPWYNFCKAYLDEGNTHQLAGSFDNFAKFYQQVVLDGKTAVGDELHNTMECMVGSEYGLTKGIWWGTCDHTRSQFMKASRGRRLAYAEHRNNWTAASIYRHPEGHVQAFGGTSERQAVTTAYRLTATDHDVFYNGLGPTREYLMELPGGTGYQKGQTNAETCVDIQDGEDIMPPLPTSATTYRLINRLSGHVMAISGNTTSNGSIMTQERYIATGKSATAQQWIVRPMGSRCGGDFSYYKIMNAADTTLLIDVRDWSLSDRGGLIGYRGGLGDNEQWYFEYAEEGWFYIRSRHSALCIEVTPDKSTSNMKLSKRALCQGIVDGGAHQQWRLLPADVAYDAKAPSAPTLLSATAGSAHVRLTWQAPAEEDIDHYIIQRSDDGKTWRTIHNHVTTADYTDNTVEPKTRYTYRVRAADRSQNRSEPSAEVSQAATGEAALICYLPLDDDLLDRTANANHGATYGEPTMTAGKRSNALVLDGKTSFLQLPSTVANSEALTICAWVYWQGGSTWQRIFDFGTDTDHYVFLTPNATGGARLAIKNGDTERTISLGSFPTNSWRHVAVTFDAEAITVYFDGQQKTRNTAIRTRPADFRPVYNYLGRSQFAADPALKGMIDDVKIYNYALSGDEVVRVMNTPDAVVAPTDESAYPAETYSLAGVRTRRGGLRSGHLYIHGGRKILIK